MKSFVIFLILIGFTTMIMPNVFASENLFYGTSSLETFPSAIVPDNSQIIEIKFQYQDGPYALSNFEPIFDIHPAEAVPYVHIEFEPVDGIVRNSIARIHGTITVDPNIPSEKIFLNISYVGTYSIEPPVNFKSGWNDSAIIDIRENLSGGRLDKIVFSMPSPLKQFKSGILYGDIQCKDGLGLVVKTTNHHFACVKPESISKLFERGWTSNVNLGGESSRHCYQEPEPGICKASREKYYFDWETYSCKSFTWGGCGGSVPFDTLESCKSLCN